MRRVAELDLMRGLAVFGILLVNVWGFVFGLSSYRYGVAHGPASLADQAAVGLVAAFAEQKFYPIFSFLFGASFALAGRGLAHAAFVRVHGRRLRWLLACGILHGTLVWYGDILTAYALGGFWLLGSHGRRLREVLRTLRTVVLLNGLITAALLLIMLSTGPMAPPGMDDLVRETAAYTRGSWAEAAQARLLDYGTNLSGLVIFLPRIMLMFLLGVLAVRMGYLTRPQRYRAFWQRLGLLAVLVALPINLWWGYVCVATMLTPDQPPPLADLANVLIDFAGPLLGAGYVAAMLLARPDALTRLLAPVGRMALTNYLSQSVLLMLLLQGFGLGLAGQLSRLGLLALCAALMLVQLAFSHAWLRHHARGPMETLWRRYATGKSSGRDGKIAG